VRRDITALPPAAVCSLRVWPQGLAASIGAGCDLRPQRHTFATHVSPGHGYCARPMAIHSADTRFALHTARVSIIPSSYTAQGPLQDVSLP